MILFFMQLVIYSLWFFIYLAIVTYASNLVLQKIILDYDDVRKPKYWPVM